MKLLEVRKIWDQAEHNAFTDLIRFKESWFCVLRESSGHTANDGSLRVITSDDGETWESAALIRSSNSDLRDAKITETPEGELMLCGAESLHDKTHHSHQTLAWFSKDGRTWSDRHEIADKDFWLWRVSWHKGTAYGVAYSVGNERDNHGFARLYASKDGKRFDTLVDNLFDVGYPNESSIIFSGDTAYCLLRRDGQPLHSDPKSALLGVSEPPYTEWEWKDLGTRVGGPHIIEAADGRLVAAVRIHESEDWHPSHTSLCWIDPEAGKFEETLRLPSGGDTSYAGLVVHEGILWVSYYDSREGKTSVYLVKVELADQSDGESSWKRPALRLSTKGEGLSQAILNERDREGLH